MSKDSSTPNSSINAERAALQALGLVRRRLSARDRLIRERHEAQKIREASKIGIPPVLDPMIGPIITPPIDKKEATDLI